MCINTTSLRRAGLALLLFAALFSQETWILAGTTGSLAGTVNDNSGAPVVGAKVTASAPSQVSSTTTDGRGHFIFVSLAPDTYTVSASAAGYDTVSQPGVAVFADNTVSVAIVQNKTIKTIAQVTSRATGALVKPSTTSDVYSVNAAAAARAAALGGGGSLNQAYSAVASVPGVYLPTGANGWNQTILIRGGDYSQVGYEYDGVPVNRSFDNYPAHTASALGQQELEVYAGSSPANAESTGLAGFINQVIRTGTYPGFGSIDAGVGSNAFYHKLAVEAGGATPDRVFSWYVGLGGYNQAFRYGDQFNAAGLSPTYTQPGAFLGVTPCPKGAPLATRQNFVSCYAASGTFGDFGFVGPGNYLAGPYGTTQTAFLSDRENVANFHFGIPHKNGGRDDIQLLYDTSSLLTTLYDSAGDWNIPGFGNFASPPSSWEYHGAMNAPLGSGSQVAPGISQYLFPTANPGPNIPANRRGGYFNDDSILKLQYQHNLSSNAYLRLYGYTFYSDWLNTDPNTVSPSNFFANGLIPEYELDSHTRGVSLQFADQLDSRNLLNLQASNVHSTIVRYNNSSYTTAGRQFGYVVDSTAPNSGLCYNLNAAGVGTPVDCFSGFASGVSLPGGANSGSSPSDPAFLAQFSALNLANPAGCGGHACELLGVENGLNGTLNQVAPTFNAYSLTDQYQPAAKLLLNLGLRYETFGFSGVNTDTGARPFWFPAWNADHCANPAPGSPAFDNSNPATGAIVPCNVNPSTGAAQNAVPATLSNASASYFYHELEPRISGTFTLNPFNVFRFSYGKYAEPGNTAAEQYNVAQQNLPGFLGAIFFPYGYTSPGHNIPPEVSNNYDLSWEHQVNGSTLSWKITPFMRATTGEQTSFFINPLQAFVSSIPVGNLKAGGVEVALNKGDFNVNGIAAQLAFTYTYATIKYTPLANGGTPLSVINNDIAAYNAYTSACSGAHAGTQLAGGIACGMPTNGRPATPCYAAGGANDPTCSLAGTYANPYWNATPQRSFNLSGPYLPTDTVVSTTGLGVNSYAVPYVATLLLNYRHDKLAITPALQFEGGQRYGVPETTEGIDPAAGCAPLGPLSPSDPRYTGGTAGLTGNSYDATTCSSGLRAIPDPFTGKFDNVGAFVAPNQLLGSLLVSYTVSPKITLQATFANLLNTCFGGSREPWTGLGTPKACAYSGTASAFVSNPVGNFYNPGTAIQPQFRYPYLPFFGAYSPNGGFTNVGYPSNAFNVFVDAHITL